MHSRAFIPRGRTVCAAWPMLACRLVSLTWLMLVASFVIPIAPAVAAGCRGIPQPKAHACGRVVCLTGDNSWEEYPVKAGKICNKIGVCDGVNVECQCPNTDTGFFYPHYLVVGLIYAPPGCTTASSSSCPVQSLVDYQAEGSMGTVLTTSNSFATDVTTSVNVGIPKVAKFTASGGFSNTSTDTDSETITKAVDLEYKLNGGGDGIDHGEDQFILLLNPAVGVAQVQVDADNNTCTPVHVAQWAAGLSPVGPSRSDQTEDLYTVYVKWLTNPSSMPANVASQLQSLGFTNEDFKALAALDPFANGSTAIDSGRYAPTTYSFPYQPPLTDPGCNGGVCPCLAKAETIKNTLQTQHTTESKASYSVGVQLQVEGIDLGIFSLGAQQDQKWTWTSGSSQSNMQGSNQSAGVTLGCPSTAYAGPTSVIVYWDTLFGSFMFATPPAGGALKEVQTGRVLRAAEKPARNVPVQVEYNGKTYHTYTDNNGAFTIYSADTSPPKATVTVGGNKTVIEADPSKTATIRIP